MTARDDEQVAMQTRCVHCLREQYAMNVLAVSLGEGPCCWCGQMSKKMTFGEFVEALRNKREEIVVNEH